MYARAVFSRNSAPRFFMCGTTDIMIGGLGTTGTISNNEIGWRGEHPASPDGCGIDFEGGSDGVVVSDNIIHDSCVAPPPHLTPVYRLPAAPQACGVARRGYMARVCRRRLTSPTCAGAPLVRRGVAWRGALTA